MQDRSIIFKTISRRKLISISVAIGASIMLPIGALYAQLRPGQYGGQGALSFQRVQADHVWKTAANPALQLLRKAQDSKKLALMGEQNTVLFGPQNIVSSQTIYRDGLGDYRCEYHAPPNVNGEIIIARPDMSWHYIPSRHELKVGKGRPNAGQIAVGVLTSAIRQGRAFASVAGQDNIAGRSAAVVLIQASGPGPGGSVRLWIDNASGALLRTDIYGANNQQLSSTYFTQFSLSPQFPAGAFDAPQVPQGTNSTQNQPGQTINHIPTDSEAGFHVLTPTYVPQGFTFESARIFQAMGLHAVSFRYKGNLSTLSISEAPMLRPTGGNGIPRSPRAGTVLLNHDGMRTVATGPLSMDDLTQVLKSMR
jgi:hypothetical protein